MNLSSPQADSGKSPPLAPWHWGILAAFVCLAAITRQSLWNDEALTAMKAMQSSLRDWWRVMLADKASDLQMPLYMIYIWGWAKIFGASELALRAANVPWFIAGIAAFQSAFDGPKKIALAFMALISPFAWYYLSEARPYAMQLGATLFIIAALQRLKTHDTPAQEQKWLLLFCFGLIALSGSSLLGMIWAGAAVLAGLVIWSGKRSAELLRAHWITALGALCLLLGLGTYYLWTIHLGARASDVGRTDTRNLVFIIYELLGLGGMGPGRLEIRDGGLSAFQPYAIPLIIYAVVTCDLLIVGFKGRRGDLHPQFIRLALVIISPAILILAAGYVKEFRVLGRHFMPLLPVIWVILWLGLRERWARHGWISRPIALIFVLLSVVSCLSFRLAARHERDDYRDAAGYAKAALRDGHSVWWNAGEEGAIYYSVPIYVTLDKPPRARWFMNPTPEMLRDLSPPETIIVSKPDVYDGRGAIAEFIAQNGYSKAAALPAFTIWQHTASH